MAILPILTFPDPRLRTVAKPVEVVLPEHKQFLDDLLETMYDSKGIGLAATQVNVHERILVADISEDRSQPYRLINPTWTPIEGEKHHSEGCLSVPGFYEDVVRPDRIKVNALNENGEAISFECDELLSVVIQHEIDHLNGKLFIDYLSNLKQNRIRKKIQKQKKFSKA